MEARRVGHRKLRDLVIEPEEVVKVYVNRVDRDYINYDYDNNIAGPAVRVLERVKINVTAANADVKAAIDLDIGPEALVKVSGVPDYEETARQVIKQLAFGIS
jgi:hypothetical protein